MMATAGEFGTEEVAIGHLLNNTKIVV